MTHAIVGDFCHFYRFTYFKIQPLKYVNPSFKKDRLSIPKSTFLNLLDIIIEAYPHMFLIKAYVDGNMIIDRHYVKHYEFETSILTPILNKEHLLLYMKIYNYVKQIYLIASDNKTEFDSNCPKNELREILDSI